jgi:hypothetical protein
MQRGQHKASAHEQSRPKRPFGADLDEIYEWLVVRCDDDHGRLFPDRTPLCSGLRRRPFGVSDASFRRISAGVNLKGQLDLVQRLLVAAAFYTKVNERDPL